MSFYEPFAQPVAEPFERREKSRLGGVARSGKTVHSSLLPLSRHLQRIHTTPLIVGCSPANESPAQLMLATRGFRFCPRSRCL